MTIGRVFALLIAVIFLPLQARWEIVVHKVVREGPRGTLCFYRHTLGRPLHGSPAVGAGSLGIRLSNVLEALALREQKQRETVKSLTASIEYWEHVQRDSHWQRLVCEEKNMCGGAQTAFIGPYLEFLKGKRAYKIWKAQEHTSPLDHFYQLVKDRDNDPHTHGFILKPQKDTIATLLLVQMDKKLQGSPCQMVFYY